MSLREVWRLAQLARVLPTTWQHSSLAEFLRDPSRHGELLSKSVPSLAVDPVRHQPAGGDKGRAPRQKPLS